jgi:hypothetical protein
MIRAKLLVVSGAPVQARGGEMFPPSFEYLSGINAFMLESAACQFQTHDASGHARHIPQEGVCSNHDLLSVLTLPQIALSGGPPFANKLIKEVL